MVFDKTGSDERHCFQQQSRVVKRHLTFAVRQQNSRVG